MAIQKRNNVNANYMVLIKDPPKKWKIGRIKETIKGTDGNVRVVIIQTPNDVIKRGIIPIYLLPLYNKT